ncbi:hypothetical protein [Streptomyces niveus]|uniref:hypothetical protein n=1 Tax=Streptomyces niveus TaxID=193462 RepID=UPI00362796FA
MAATGVAGVGYQAHDPQGNEKPEATLNDLVASVKATGAIGVVGVLANGPRSAPPSFPQ